MGQPKNFGYLSSLFAPTDSNVSELMKALAEASSPKSKLPQLPDFSLASLFGPVKPKLPLDGLAGLFGKPEPPKPSGISFRRVDGQKVSFCEPMHFPWYGTPPSFPAVYVILVPDSAWTPLAFRPIYFGETGSADTRPTRSHEHYDNWCRVARGAENLHVAYCWMFDSTKDQRVSVESGLIKQYDPECNTVYTSWVARAMQSSVVPGAPTIPAANSDYAGLLEAAVRQLLK